MLCHFTNKCEILKIKRKLLKNFTVCFILLYKKCSIWTGKKKDSIGKTLLFTLCYFINNVRHKRSKSLLRVFWKGHIYNFVIDIILSWYSEEITLMYSLFNFTLTLFNLLQIWIWESWINVWFQKRKRVVNHFSFLLCHFYKLCAV